MSAGRADRCSSPAQQHDGALGIDDPHVAGANPAAAATGRDLRRLGRAGHLQQRRRRPAGRCAAATAMQARTRSRPSAPPSIAVTGSCGQRATSALGRYGGSASTSGNRSSGRTASCNRPMRTSTRSAAPGPLGVGPREPGGDRVGLHLDEIAVGEHRSGQTDVPGAGAQLEDRPRWRVRGELGGPPALQQRPRARGQHPLVVLDDERAELAGGGGACAVTDDASYPVTRGVSCPWRRGIQPSAAKTTRAAGSAGCHDGAPRHPPQTRTVGDRPVQLPEPRGPLTGTLVAALRADDPAALPHPAGPGARPAHRRRPAAGAVDLLRAALPRLRRRRRQLGVAAGAPAPARPAGGQAARRPAA